ncbi:MAG: PIN domain-containing protein [Gammaproteobacteria bacterium]|nr:PIN domain-containing protein [Gammaproteobacteria bacterium]
MLITIDTSVLIAVINNEPSKMAAVEITEGHDLVAPASVHWEIGNALSAMIKRQLISLEQADRCIAAYQDIAVRLIEVGLAEALVWSKKHRIHAYDAYLLQCAQQTKSALLTLDQALGNIAKAGGMKVLEV